MELKGSEVIYRQHVSRMLLKRWIRVDVVEKLQQHWPDRAQIGLFTYTFAKNTPKYVAYEGFKRIPGATVVSKLVSDTMREVKQENHKVGIKTETIIVERDMRKSTLQADNFSQNENLSSQNAVGDGEVGILVKDLKFSTSQPENFYQKGNFLAFKVEVEVELELDLRRSRI
uniref:uncharacterized protein LOC122600993 n=1 Tax=Erigeron canadensis TaxID=72917 RepID=UPI001CB9B3E4|nr:uncharacterized protein LOC122600993 [Erigeron canadensis]